MHFAPIFLRLYRLLFFLPQAGKHGYSYFTTSYGTQPAYSDRIGFGGLLFIFKTRSRWLFRCSDTLCWSNMNHETSSCFVCLTGTIISHISYIIYHIYIYHLYIAYKWLFQWWIFLCRLPGEADMLKISKDLNNLAVDSPPVRQNDGVLVRMGMHPYFERITMAVIFLNAVWSLGCFDVKGLLWGLMLFL